MANEGSASHRWSPAELKRQLEVGGDAMALIVYRVPSGEQRLLELGEDMWRVTMGREDSCDLPLEDDEEVSRLHAVLERMGQHWVLVDDGLSRNGSYVNGERVAGRRRLRDGDAVRIGSTHLVYRCPAQQRSRGTQQAAGGLTAGSISATQRRILIALCRPFRDGEPFATTPSNRVIADEVALSEARVKAQLRDLFAIFNVAALPHNQKRVRLAEHALHSGLISRHELLH